MILMNVVAIASSTSRPNIWCELSNTGVGEDDSPIIHGSRRTFFFCTIRMYIILILNRKFSVATPISAQMYIYLHILFT